MFISYLYRAKGSSGEVRSQLYVALDQDYVSQVQFDRAYDLADKTSRQLGRFIAYLESHPDRRAVREQGAAYNVEAF